jgi:hypothetical protein
MRKDILVLTTATKNSNFETTELEKNYDRQEKTMARECEDKKAKMETDLNKEALDENILRFRAFEKVEQCMDNKTVHTQTQQVDPDDFVSNLAQTWFVQKEASKPN